MSRIHITSSDILRVLDGGRRLTIVQLMSKFCVTHPTAVRGALGDLMETGEVKRIREYAEGDGDASRSMYVYFTSEPIPVGKPYRDMRLTECLVGYESAIRRHENLCLATRRAA